MINQCIYEIFIEHFVKILTNTFFFSVTHETTTKSTTYWTETHLKIFKKIKIIFWILSDHKDIKLNIKKSKTSRKHGNQTKHYQIKNGKKENWEDEFEIPSIEWKWKYNISKSMGCNEGIVNLILITWTMYLKVLKKIRTNNSPKEKK